MNRLVIPVGLTIAVSGLCFGLWPDGQGARPEPASVAATFRAEAPSQGSEEPAPLPGPDDSASPQPRVPFDVADGAGRILAQYGIEREVWQDLERLTSAQLDAEVEKTRAAFEGERSRTVELAKEHNRLALERNDDAANDLVANRILPLLEQRQVLVGRMLLIAHARRRLVELAATPSQEESRTL